MNAKEINLLFDAGILTIDMDKESGYYGETTTTVTVKYRGEVVRTETHSTFCDCSPRGCCNYTKGN